MIRVLAIVYEKHTKTDQVLKTEVRNQCCTLLEHQNNIKFFGPLRTKGKPITNYFLKNHFSLGNKYISETSFETPQCFLEVLVFMKVTLLYYLIFYLKNNQLDIC